tara:strand:+ start:13967 stop:15676 length:1710 start_codon:yes stop_codon:yes gene_type:complete
VRVLLAISVCAVIAACAQQPSAPPIPEPASETLRELTQGPVIGFRNDRGAEVWRGVAFAAPPIGDLRWRAPRPAPHHDDVVQALSSPDRCLQMTNGFDMEFDGGLLVGSEDCLYLDIYAPPDASGRDLPVMLWLHGGSNTWGYAAQYDGTQLALDQGMIVVVAQYRLGPMGWFAHPALRADARQAEDAAANFALLDQIAALQWIHDNIGAFGGDTGRVAIAGESAGAHDVAALMSSPLAEGLFQRAIIQSGSLRSVTLAEAEGRTPLPASILDEVPGLTAAERFAGPDPVAADMRAASAEDVFAAYGEADMPRVIEDGVTLMEGGMRAAFADPDRAMVPVIIGTNRDESRLYLAVDPEFTRTTLGVFLTRRDPERYVANGDFGARLWRLDGVDDAADRLTRAGHSDVWAYRFDWDEGGSFLFTDTGEVLGAAHTMELPFVFNDFSILYGDLGKILFTDGNASGRDYLADAMGDYWGAFIRDGRPDAASADHIDWPAWQAGGLRMRFDTPASGGLEMITGEEDWASLTADALASPALLPVDRCAMADVAVMRDPAAGEAMRAAFGCEPAG